MWQAIKEVREGDDPANVAQKHQVSLAALQQGLLQEGVDWAPRPRRGRPPRPLLLGQELYIEYGYRAGLPRTQLSLTTRVAIPRLRRHLQEKGMYHAPLSTENGEPARRSRVLQAIQMYLQGDRVAEILRTQHLGPAELYAALHERGIALRSQSPQEVSREHTTGT